MASVIEGRVWWGGDRDSEGYRTFKVKHQIRAEVDDGPLTILNTPGLPIPGAFWFYGNDVDLFSFCQPNVALTPLQSKQEGFLRWHVENTFTSKPPDKQQQQCQDAAIDDPLLEPMKVSGSFVKMTKEATHDRFGFPLVSSSWEQIRGPTVEFDESRPNVHVEQNVPLLQLDLITSLRDTVNLLPMWGLPPRTVKLSTIAWDKVYYGQCGVYYTRKFDFDIDFNGWDRYVLDEGTKALHGHWDNATGFWVLDNIAGEEPNRFNPQHFDRMVDRQNNPMRVLLNGAGLPADVTVIGNTQYISVADDNTGNVLTDVNFWKPVNSTTSKVWDSTVFYNIGDVVAHATGTGITSTVYYLAIAANIASEPPSPSWLLLPNGIRDKGLYDIQVTYVEGDVVKGGQQTSFGSIFITKYAFGNHFLLGIPTVL